MKFKQTLVACAFVLLSSSLKATEFETFLGVGLDSNPHQLSSDSFNIDSQEYAEFRFNLNADWLNMFYLNANLATNFYPDDTRAESLNVFTELAFKNDFSLWETRYLYGFSAINETQDKTFVSKQTGAVATLNGISLADRYDYDDNGYSAFIGFSSSANFDYQLSFISNSRDYVDFNSSPLDRLDYDEQTTIFNVKLNTNNSGYFNFDIGSRNRAFVERNDRDFDGNLIADSSLEYNDVISSLSYVYEQNEKSRWVFSFNFINRYSNGTDYYESERASINIKADLILADYHHLNILLGYQEHFFDDNLEQSYELFEEDLIEKAGFIIDVEYAWVLATLFETNLGFFINLQAELFASPTDQFDYQQAQVNVGVRWALD